MRRRILVWLSIITAIVVIANPAVSSSLFMLLFLGIIPGTSITIPFWILIPVFVFSALAALLWLLSQPLYIGSIPSQEHTARQIARKKVSNTVKRRAPVRNRRKMSVIKTAL